MKLDDPRLVSECKKIVEQRLYDVSSFADLILQTYGTGIKFIQVYDSADQNAMVRLYDLDDVVSAEERGEIEFVKGNEHIDHSNGEDWCIQFTDGLTIQPIKYNDVLAAIEPGDDPEDLICEANSKFRNAALALATLAGLGGGYNMLDHDRRFNEPSIIDVANIGMNKIADDKVKDQCVAPEYVDEPTPNAKYNNTNGIVSATPHWRNQRIDYKDKDGNIVYSLGLGNLSSRAHNPGNLVVNDMDSAKKMGAINYYQQGKGNKYAIFPNDQAGQRALENWWFTGNNPKMTVNQLLPKFAPSHENNLNDYFRTMRRFCVPLDKPINQFTSTEKTNLINAVKTHEGFRTKKAGEYDKYSAYK